MTLPIDRTSKSTLDTNLVNGNTSDAPAVKNSNDVVYNTIDELYNYAQGLVNAGILTQASKTPIANKIAQRDANGSVLSALPLSNGQKPNLLFNPSFRLGSTGWTGIGTNGFLTSWGTLGDGGILFNNGNMGATSQGVLSPRIPIIAGQVISISAEMSAIGVTVGSMATGLLFYNSSDVLIGRIDLIATNGIGATKYSGSGTTPVGTSYMVVNPYLGINVTNTNAVWAKIKVESGSVATTFSDDNTLNTIQYGSILPFTQVLSGGNKKQNGSSVLTVATAGTQVTLAVTFPIPFATAPNIQLSWFINTGNAGYINVTWSNVTTTGFTIAFNSYIAQSATVNWEATGT